MKVYLNENQFVSIMVSEALKEYDNAPTVPSDGNAEHNPYAKKLDADMKLLENLLSRSGVIMTNIENGKDYLVYELNSLSTIIGKRFCLARLMKENEPYGSIFTKPLELFKVKVF